MFKIISSIAISALLLLSVSKEFQTYHKTNIELFLTKENGLYYPLKVHPQSYGSNIEVGMELEANVSNSDKSFIFKVESKH